MADVPGHVGIFVGHAHRQGRVEIAARNRPFRGVGAGSGLTPERIRDGCALPGGRLGLELLRALDLGLGQA